MADEKPLTFEFTRTEDPIEGEAGRLRELLAHVSRELGQQAFRVEIGKPSSTERGFISMVVTHSLGREREEELGAVVSRELGELFNTALNATTLALKEADTEAVALRAVHAAARRYLDAKEAATEAFQQLLRAKRRVDPAALAKASSDERRAYELSESAEGELRDAMEAVESPTCPTCLDHGIYGDVNEETVDVVDTYCACLHGQARRARDEAT